MGRDKALVELAGRPLIELVAAAIDSAGLDVVVAGPPRDGVDLPVVPDAPGSGPVAGVLGALDALPGHDLLVVAVDQPLLRPDTVLELLATPGSVVAPLDGGVPQVTCAVYRPDVAATARTVLASARPSLRAVIDNAGATLVAEGVWRSWGEDGRSWASVDTEADLAEMERALGGGPGPLRSPS